MFFVFCPLQEAIKEVVRLLWGENREVPLIASYHHEAVGELLSMRREVRMLKITGRMASNGSCGRHQSLP